MEQTSNWAKIETLGSKRYGTPEQRFFKAVIPEPNSGCWLYSEGYEELDGGHVRVRFGDCREKAHRLSWRMHRGPIPAGVQVLHKCDVACCVNPDHLFLGTAVDNVVDKVKKDRQAKGRRSPSAKLTESDVIAIRKMSAEGAGRRELGRIFGVSHGIICNIVYRRDWKHVP